MRLSRQLVSTPPLRPGVEVSGWDCPEQRAAPGFALVTSTKPHLLTALERKRNGHPVTVLDTNRTGPPWQQSVRWSPITGCADLATAGDGPPALIAASPHVDNCATLSAHGFFTARPESTLAGYPPPPRTPAPGCSRCSTGCPTADHPAQLALVDAGLPVQASRVAAVQRLVSGTRDGIYATVAKLTPSPA